MKVLRQNRMTNESYNRNGQSACVYCISNSYETIIVSPTRSGDIMDYRRPQRFLVSDLQSTFLSGFLSYLAGGLIW